MSMAREVILKTAMELSESDRILLATELSELSPEHTFDWSLDDPAFMDELETRANDATARVSLEDVLAQLRADLQG